ncbi:hypothetical protein B0537_13490 [Desulforamulus ferrireducens]|uniref:histidine kinase n=2 Tax=Desulforamulus ferrireducens TaxID=1833852 RepID=A0A1S6IYZ5_9FIRM|nr:hypothetical protein B0537_13490 [Desulforamulus ferrireducens]
MNRLSNFGRRLIILGIAAALPIILYLIYNSYKVYLTDAIEARKGAMGLASMVAINQEAFIKQSADNLMCMSSFREIRNFNLPYCDDFFPNVLKQHQSYKTIGLANLQGHVLSCAGSYVTNVSNESFFKKVIDTRETTILVSDSSKGEICSAVPILDVEGRVQGVLFIYIDIQAAIQEGLENKLPPDTSLSVRDDQGNILFRYPDEGNWSGKFLPDTEVFRIIKGGQGKGYGESPGLDGITRVFGFYEVQGLDSPLFIVVGLSKDISYSRARVNLVDNIIVIILVMVLMAFVIYKVCELFNQTESKFRTIFEASNDVILIIDINTERIVESNQKCEQILGYSPREICNNTLEFFTAGYYPYTGEEGSKLLQRAAQGEPQQVEWLCKDKAGNHLYVEVSIVKVRLQDKDYLLMTLRDIDERRRIETEMARLDRLHVVGEMAAGIAHEIRNPLTTVRGFIQIMAAKKQFADYKEQFSLMIDELDRANSIISEYLSVAKNKTTDMELNNLNTIIKAIYPLIEADANNNGKKVELNLAPVPDLVLNEKEIRQVILNLTRNGLDAMTEGQKLTIATFCEDEEVVLSIKDEGTGIKPEVLSKLGTPFLTTKPEGTGLGLALCYSIAERHQAKIEFTTGPKGTTVQLRFSCNTNCDQHSMLACEAKLLN